MMRGGLASLCGTNPPRTVALAVTFLALLVPAVTAAQGVELNDIEDEVMCPICGTLLELAQSPQAQRQRAFIRRQIAAGRDKEEIQRALVAQYGDAVLALPGDSGFDLSAYLVPAVAFVAAAAALAIGLGRWRRAGRSATPGDPLRGPEGEEADRLEADIARYDL
jgi:cytochrome c-type biogenesis protein CcmH/NrfF